MLPEKTVLEQSTLEGQPQHIPLAATKREKKLKRKLVESRRCLLTMATTETSS